ncbi:MAG: ABC transporter permease [Candidatus Methylomirabilales bacterium]
MIPLRPIRSIATRELKRFFRQRGRFFAALARPLLWLFIVGIGINRIVETPAGISYLQFLFPGIVGMVVLFSSIHSALSTVYDREFGVMRLILVAPISRLTIVGGKVASGSLLSLLQAAVLLCLAPLIGIPLGVGQILLLTVCILLTAVAITGVGLLLASRIDSLENFAGVMNFVVFPMFFLSGGLYPVKLLPDLLQWVIYANPLAYGIDLFKHALLPGSPGTALGPDFSLATNLAMLLAFSTVTIAGATALFDKEARLVRLATR